MSTAVASTEQFQVRRIKKAVNTLNNKQYNVQSWKVKKVAGLKDKFGQKFEELITQEIMLQSDNGGLFSAAVEK
ncbi:hypothetical protein PAT3040_00394 [Paenibacillus agaridevorans]|uniref:Uncharacterized protein n=1 Tax=Paenibacillus agaridevorans TaxID=171404 RepID=A0A2R5EJV6_9BACL|nr:hypothetical protein [Paenibacillus agaridevorans]GBG05909.1 hypothetical protein PAT3040_00394 [Paenibacillus agaridevorans]